MIEPKNGEWWLCERGGVKTVFLRKDDEWRSDEKDTYDYCNVTPLFKMIEDNPSSCVAGKPKRTRTEYEKVTESIFDLRDEFKRGELYCKHEIAREFTQVINTQTLAQALHGGFCFRKVEREIDWRDEVREFLESCKQISNSSQLESFTYKGGCSDKNVQIENELHDNEFLELCRVALRANGELE